jgi:hypothetical protein
MTTNFLRAMLFSSYFTTAEIEGRCCVSGSLGCIPQFEAISPGPIHRLSVLGKAFAF